ncbi:MAG: TIGR00730 family Rossman fold protein [Bacteroidales bacterium]|nr:TIGR00730 family Rossman fold protein [Bacteroidales bacterium]
MAITSVCVYCASSSKVDPAFFDAAERLGKILAANKITCVYGGGNRGLMCTLADSVLENGGTVKGIIPHFMHEEGWSHGDLSQLDLVSSMHERKHQMSDGVDAAIALPGGCGTMEELLEIITWKQLGLYKNPIIIVNTNGYYNPLLEMFEKALEGNFIRDIHAHIWSVVDQPEEVLAAIEKAGVWMDDARSKAAI